MGRERDDTTNVKKLIIVPWLQGGGAQAALQGILKRLQRDDVTVLILFKGSRNSEPLEAMACRVVKLGHSKTPWGAFIASRKLRVIYERAEVAYSLMRAGHLVLGLLPLRTLLSTPLAITFHQLPSQDSQGLAGWAEDILVKRTSRIASLVTAPSARAVIELKERGFSQKPQVEPNIVEGPHGRAAHPRSGELTPLRLLFAGRIAEQKGLDQVPFHLNASSVPIDLEIAGDGEMTEAVYRTLRSVVDTHAVKMLGHIDNVGAHIERCDAVYLPSKWELNPMIIWEAWARGKPVIGSSIPALKDLEKTGPIFCFDSAAHFSEIASKLATSQKLRDKCRAEGFRAVKNAQARSKIVDFLA